jgi:hypothetical protein
MKGGLTMVQNLYILDAREALLWIRKGLPVFDCENIKIGKVNYVQLGDVLAESPTAKPQEFYHLPPDIQPQLAQDGFVKVDCGLFNRNRIVTPEQIQKMDYEALRLNVTCESLLKI